MLFDTRKYMLCVTLLICAYALLFILLQYSLFLLLRVLAVAGSFLNDCVNDMLRTFGGQCDNRPPAAAVNLPTHQPLLRSRQSLVTALSSQQN